MKISTDTKIFLLLGLLVVLLSVNIFGNILDSEKINVLFFEARRDHDVEKILNVIQTIENSSGFEKNSRFLTILADAFLEYGLWGVNDDKKEEIYQKARSYAEDALKLKSNNGRAAYIVGSSIGRLAQYKGIVESLFMLGDFDDYINNAIKLLDENDEEQRLYKTFAYIALGMRYRDVPWPLHRYKKSEQYFKEALKLAPNYSNIYLELGYLYLKTNDEEKAKEMFKKVISMEPHPWLIKTHMEAVKSAQEELEKLK